MSQRILITGGAGFVGSSLAILFQQHHDNCAVICLDNLKRRGSELSLSRLRKNGIEFRHGDIRNKEDLEGFGKIDWIIDCSAEPSALAGVNESPNYLLNTNLVGTINCLELARACESGLLFVSTSRVYPFHAVNSVPYYEQEHRFAWKPDHRFAGVTTNGISEEFPLNGPRTLYGATKLCSELLLREYSELYGVRTVVDRCGVLTGSWQMGKVDQGFVVLWMARHFWGGTLSYYGYGGLGKQVRDILHVADLFDLIDVQIHNWEIHNGQTYNVGGGGGNSVSLQELTFLCREVTGNTIPIQSVPESRPGDVRIYVSDYGKVRAATGWKPKRSVEDIVSEIAQWIASNQGELQPILS